MPHDVDVFQTVFDLAVEQGFPDAGPWAWGKYRVAACRTLVVAKRPPRINLDPVPANVRMTIDGLQEAVISTPRRLDKFRTWAGEPFRLRCRCHCGHEHSAEKNVCPGWLGDYLVDRRLVALALALAQPAEKTCRVALLAPKTGHGGPIRIWTKSFWAIVMGLRHDAGQHDAPRFALC